MNGESRHARGLTKSEMLVIAAIILMMLGLLYPLLLKAKKKEYSIKCLDNLKQIGLAIENYARSHSDRLPGILNYAPADDADYEQGSPFFFNLLPYVGRDDVYKAGFVGMGLTPWSNIVGYGGSVQESVVPTFICPDDPTVVLGGKSNFSDGYMLSACSYAPNARMLGVVNATPGVTHTVLVPLYNCGTIPDGASNTIFLEERPAGYAKSTLGTYKDWCNSWAQPAYGYGPWPTFTPYFNPWSSLLHPMDATNTAAGAWNNLGTESYSAIPPVARMPIFKPSETISDPTYPGSYHPGYTIVLLGDGSARVISASISPTTWSAAIHPDDKVQLGVDWK